MAHDTAFMVLMTILYTHAALGGLSWTALCSLSMSCVDTQACVQSTTFLDNLPAGRPARIPWLEDASPDAVPRFICDVMTEGLARQLRLCGIDARSAPVTAGRQRYRAYMELVGSAAQEHRIILTADTIFLRAGYATQSRHLFYIHEQPQPIGASLYGWRMAEESH